MSPPRKHNLEIFRVLLRAKLLDNRGMNSFHQRMMKEKYISLWKALRIPEVRCGVCNLVINSEESPNVNINNVARHFKIRHKERLEIAIIGYSGE